MGPPARAAEAARAACPWTSAAVAASGPRSSASSGRPADAADLLNQALLIVPDDPAVLQERAEVALLQGQYDRAETAFATMAPADWDWDHLLAGVGWLHLSGVTPALGQRSADAVLEATNGQLGALYNNGAYGQPGALEDLSTEVLRHVFEVNVLGWHDLTRWA